MAIGRSGMTKELFGNRTKKMSHGGVVAPGDGGKETTSKALKSAATPALKKGGEVKNTRSPVTVNNNPKKVVRAYKTASGAQQYVRGNTIEDRRGVVDSHAKAGSPAFRRLMAVDSAENSKNFSRIVGPKDAKKDTTVAMYNKHERSWADSADAAKPGSKAKRGMKSGGTVSKKMK
jgi:hypothetical protein